MSLTEDQAFFNKQHGAGRHPCYVRGDFNRDRVEDFAVLLYDPKNPRSPGALAIFNGRVQARTPSLPDFFEQSHVTEKWMLWCDVDGGSTTLYEGIAESDNFTWFTWKSRGYVQHAPDLE
jgi:hypothetical protein